MLFDLVLLLVLLFSWVCIFLGIGVGVGGVCEMRLRVLWLVVLMVVVGWFGVFGWLLLFGYVRFSSIM